MTDTNRNTVTGASSTSASEASTAPTSQTNTPPSVDTIPKSTSYPTSINAPLPYWLVNVPAHLHSSIPSCPPFLAGANAKDRGILSTPDSDYRLMTWQEVCDIIKANRLDLFQRTPSDLRRYLEYIAQIRASHGSVMHFVLTERLRWMDLTPQNRTPFADDRDVKILPNDWPYGLEKDIVHLVVWVKFELEEVSDTDELTPETSQSLERFVDKVFRGRLGAERVVWFKNWGSLKSIRSVEHFHVLLNRPEESFVKEVTGGVRALSEIVGR